MATNNSLRVERAPALIRAQVLDNLRQAIIERRLIPGQRLIERELVELTGVSRTSIREALRELAAEGLVTTIPNRGTVVTSIGPDEARQLYELRAALEALAGRLFVLHATEAQRRGLVRAVEAVERLTAKGSPVLAANDVFYRRLFDGTANEALRTTTGSLHARVSALRSSSLAEPGRLQNSAGELRAIIDAILAGDADAAARACAHHVEEAGRAVQAALAGAAGA